MIVVGGTGSLPKIEANGFGLGEGGLCGNKSLPAFAKPVLAVSAFLGRSKFQIINIVLVGLIKTNKNKMYNEAKEESVKANDYVRNDSPVKSEPEFKILLDRLTKETSHSIDLSNEIFRYANTIKPIYQPDKLNEVEQNPQGIIEMFESQIWKLSKSNSQLIDIANHLRGLIGN